MRKVDWNEQNTKATIKAAEKDTERKNKREKALKPGASDSDKLDYIIFLLEEGRV